MNVFKVSNKKIIVIGGGGHSKVVISTLLELGYNVIGVLDDDINKKNTKVMGIPILGSIELLKSGNFEQGIIAIGDNKIRKEILYKFKDFCKWPVVVHPFSYVHPSVEIGEGTVIFAGAVIQPDVIIGEHVIVNTGVTIDHDCRIGNFVHLAPGVHLAGGVVIGEGSFLGIGSSVIPYKNIGSWAIVGAGGVVIQDIPDFVKVVGVPAKPIK
ncbi:MAG: acetyltransferase [Candidatus Methanomethylicaceae archaeon]